MHLHDFIKNRFNRKQLKYSVIILIGCLFMTVLPLDGMAVQTYPPKGQNAHILVVYSTKSGKIDDKIRMLDMLLGHFSKHIVYKEVKEVKPGDFTDVSYLFYYGGVETEIPSSFRVMSNHFKGTYVAIGANIEQLGKSFHFVHVQSKTSIKQLMFTKGKQHIALPVSNLIYEINVDHSAQVLVDGLNGHKKYPVFVKLGSHYYFARSELTSLFNLFLAEGLHTVFHRHLSALHPAYIRLEDVSPATDPEKLMRIGKFLKKEHVPYMIAVIPVYKDPKTHREYHYTDRPKVAEALRYMQKNGGSIVLHGYAHQYRNDQTGEGFEFWDVKNNTPIFGPPHQTVQDRNDFQNQSSDQVYLQSRRNFEKQYINKKLTKGIQELVSEGLYPLAFEAPHYTMSLEGYNIVAQYFSTYVGQIQMSNKDWHMMRTAPYITTPSLLHGMVLLPETIGYVPEGSTHAVKDMMKKAKQQLVVKDGIIGGFYHPFLGIDPFRKLIHQMEQIPNIRWIDLKKRKNEVTSSKVKITSGSNGLHVKSHLLFTKYKFSTMVKEIVKFAKWILFIVSLFPMVIGFVLVGFVLLVLYWRKIKSKRVSN